MLRKLREAQEKEEGFTLIELLVVVIIIGILAAIAIPAFLNQRQNAWQAELISNVRNTALDLEAAATTNGGTPAAEGAANTLPAGVTGVGGGLAVYYYDVNGTNWCLAATSTRDITGTVVYRSGAGLQQPPYNAADATGQCTA